MIVVCPVSFDKCSAVSQTIRGKRTLDVAIGGYRFVGAITDFSALELINVLANQVTFDSVPGLSADLIVR
jgi:hypothetical protein